jgi:histidyl-tRNA synthetase
VDAIGSRSPLVETEMLAAISEILQKLGFSDFTIHLNHRQLLTATLNRSGVDPSLHATALVALDKLDKIGRAGVLEEMAARGVPSAAASAVLDTAAPSEWGSFPDPEGAAAYENVEAILNLCEATAAKGHMQFAPFLARGLSYYTGAIMEVSVPDLAGSLGGGGRYDGLIGMFLGEDVPACGFSLGLERILVVMGERKMFPPSVEGGSAEVLVTLFDSASIPEGLKLAAELRAADLRVELYPEPDKLGKQMKYAASKLIPFAAILGSDEIARGEVTIKNLTAGTQESIPRATVASEIASRMAAPGSKSANRGPRIANRDSEEL